MDGRSSGGESVIDRSAGADDEVLLGSATSMARAVREGRIGPVELVTAQLRRIERLQPGLNAFACLDADGALARARLIEKRLRAGEAVGPLAGVPFTVKELIDVAGLPQRQASRLCPERRPSRHAVVVERLAGAGAVLLGSTNVSELGFFPETSNLIYGATRNPHDLECSVAGSSGGEAAAVAAGLSAMGVGSDYAGSIRAPAHATGIVGLRPGLGEVPFDGHAPRAPMPGRLHWSVIGPMTRCAEDASLMLGVMSGVEGGPTGGPPIDAPPPRACVLPPDTSAAMDPACASALDDAVTALSGAGVEVEQARPPNPDAAVEVLERVTAIETRVYLSRFFPDRLSEASPELDSIWDSVAGLQPRLEVYLELLSRRPLLEREAEEWISSRNVLLMPVARSPAHRLGHRRVRIDHHNLSLFELYEPCAWASAVGLPAAAIPVGRSSTGLPVGVQLVGRRGGAREILAVAELLEQALGGSPGPPSSVNPAVSDSA